MLPFSVGEFMIIAGILWLILIPFIKWIRKHTIKLLIIIAAIMTLNCFINYHCTPIKESYEDSGREFTVEELAELRDYIVEKCNALAVRMPRDENGEIIYDEAQMQRVSGEAVNALENRFPKLSGFYVTPKPMLFSGFISQQYMCGYYFPFSMEANYNKIMYISNKPFTMCHELAHLACTESEDMFFEYSGYLGVLNYVNNAFYENVTKEEYLKHTKVSDLVRADDIFLTKENWKKVEESSPLDTETVKKAADTFVDTTLKVNGVNDGKASYNRVIELMLLEYFSEKQDSNN
jgi:hypothetical protein